MNRSMAAMSGSWLRRKVFHPWLGGLRRLTMYLATLEASALLRGAKIQITYGRKHATLYQYVLASPHQPVEQRQQPQGSDSGQPHAPPDLWSGVVI
jgi:hypothetical protein